MVVLGLSGAPNAGDELLVVESERKAREVAMHRQSKSRDVKLAQKATNMQDVFSTMGESKADLVQILVKADVQGSAEALARFVEWLVDARGGGEHRCLRGRRPDRVGRDAGGRVEGAHHRLQRAWRCGGARRHQGAWRRCALLQHHLRSHRRHQSRADRHAVAGGQGSRSLGLAEVRSVFRSSKFGTVAGCMVIDGYVRRNFPIRVLRNNVVIFEGALESLKRFKDDVTEVRAGTECGIGVKNYNDVQEGDQIECYSRVEVARTL